MQKSDDMSSSKSPCFVAQIDLSLSRKLQNDLLERGFQLTTPPYTIFSAQKKGISCTLYTSGKLTVQGKEMDEFIEFYLEPEILKTLAYSHPEVGVDLTARIGIDEAGKGDFFGPLCIAGVFADEKRIHELLAVGVKDSKTLSDKQILVLKKKIQQICPHTIVRIPPKKYNELYQSFRNLNRLLGWGHATAIAELISTTGCQEIIIDKFADESVVESALRQKQLQPHLVQKTKAESDPVVAAASILARAAFVEGIDKLSESMGMTLPKGASAAVIKAGKDFVLKYGPERLGEVAKLHFKTRDEVLN
jgi:ribonuclease HIII